MHLFCGTCIFTSDEFLYFTSLSFFAQSDQSSFSVRIFVDAKCKVKSLIRRLKCTGRSISSLGPHVRRFVSDVSARFIFYLDYLTGKLSVTQSTGNILCD